MLTFIIVIVLAFFFFTITMEPSEAAKWLVGIIILSGLVALSSVGGTNSHGNGDAMCGRYNENC